MNVSYNPYRAVPFAESECIHTFRALRQFPQLLRPLSGIEEAQKTNGRTWDLNENSRTIKGIKKHPKAKKSSSRILSQFCRSSSGEVTAMQDFHRSLIQNRLNQRELSAESYPVHSRSTTETPLGSARAKLAKVAIKYDYTHKFDVELKGFVGARMNIDEFDTQLKRGLHLWISRDEVEALFFAMDSDGNNILDPEEFLSYFFQLGHESREEVRQVMLQNRHLEEERQRGHEQSEETKASRMVEVPEKICTEFTDEDVQTAVRKLQRAAFLLDASNAIQAVRIRVFECRLTPSQFRLQLEKSFDLDLTSAEMGALVTKFGTRKAPHSIDGHYFVHYFLQMQ
eukprot:gene39335-51839_t